MKNSVKKLLVIVALTSPIITLSALSGNFSTFKNSTLDAIETTNHSVHLNEISDGSIMAVNASSDSVPESKKAETNNPLYQGNGNSGNNPMHETKSADATRRRVEVLKSNKTTESADERKGWDGSVKGNSKGITQSGIKRTETERKGWDGSVKGSSKGINQEGIKRTENERKGWDGSVKGSSKGIQESGIKRNEAQRKGWDGTVKGGSIQEESINGIKIPDDSMQQKANINTSRSNIKRGIRNPADSLQQNSNINTSRAGIKGDNRSSSHNLGENDDTSNGSLPAKAEAQDFNTTRNNRERGQLKTDNSNTSESVQSATTNKITKAQDFNTTRSNRENR